MKDNIFQPRAPEDTPVSGTSFPSTTGAVEEADVVVGETVPGTALAMPDPDDRPTLVDGRQIVLPGGAYHVVPWGGKSLYECDKCAYSSFDVQSTIAHSKRHR